MFGALFAFAALSGSTVAPICPDLTVNAEALCADRAIASAWAETDALFGQWLAVDPRRSVIEERREDLVSQFRRGFEYSEDQTLQSAGRENIVESLGYAQVELRDQIFQAKSISTGPDLLARLADDCMALASTNCTVTASGTLNSPSEAATRRIVWQHLATQNPEFGNLMQMVIAWDVTDAAPMLIGFSTTDGEARPARLIDNGEQLIVHLPAHTAGTGNGNADTLYLFDGTGWTNIGMAGWKEELAAQLPEGLALWKGVEYDYYGLSSSFPLWRDDDANCCPTGGEAYVSFSVKDNRLSIESLDVRRGPALQLRSPQCPIEQAVYRFPWPATRAFDVRFVKPPFAPNAASDLVMVLNGRDPENFDDDAPPLFTRYFAFAGSQGFGSTALVAVDGLGKADGGDDDGPPDPQNADEEGADAFETLYFHAFEGSNNGMKYRAEPPQSGDMAPMSLFLPDLAKMLWYDGYRVAGQAGPVRVDMPRDMLNGVCEDE